MSLLESATILTQHRMTALHFVLLKHMEEAKGMTELASLASISTASITQHCDALVRQNLITRWQDEDDRRKVYCQTTAEGRKVVGEIEARVGNDNATHPTS